MKQMLRLSVNRAKKAPQWLRLFAKSAVHGRKPRYAVTSMDLCDDPSLRVVLGERPFFFSRLLKSQPDTVVGWGRKWSGRRAADFAADTGCGLLLLEDGFVRSVARHDPSVAFVLDDCGIFYDSLVPSGLDRLVPMPLDDAETERADDLMQLWRDSHVSKYNSAPEYAGVLPPRYVLVVDQVAGDMSIGYGAADQTTFMDMLQAARRDNPDAQVILKVHPDVYTHARKGHFDLNALAGDPQIQIIAENCHPVRLIQQAEAVYTVSSQIGFEALIWGRPVRCFGMPFYAGYGLTQDAQPAPKRRSPVSLQQLVHAALIKYSRYIDPETGETCQPERAISHIGLQRSYVMESCEAIYAVNFSRWKQPFLSRFLPASQIIFVKTTAQIPQGATVVVWGNRDVSDLPSDAKIMRAEDGFLRSAGLGADLITPMSWVIDDMGIYYDPRRPSRLEHLLQENAFGPRDLERADMLVERITTMAISKYNLGGEGWDRPVGAEYVILVPGQVEADASIQCGAPEISTNLGLLRAVRDANPQAYIIYKPHPDVVAGLRRAGQTEDQVSDYCDQVVTNVDITSMLGQIDALHTLTSLSGFEALLRGVSVTCYGQPFYAGWGLTQDVVAPSHRTTKLELRQLVAGALIAYPRYVSLKSQQLTSPERTIDELALWRKTGPSRMSLWRRGIRAILQLWAKSGLKRNA